MGKINIDKIFQEHMKDESLTPTPEPASLNHPLNVSDNPLRILIEGPMDGWEMEGMAQDLAQDIPSQQVRELLLNLERQYNQDNNKVLVPPWWKGNPEQFVSEFNQEKIQTPTKSASLSVEKQSNALELLLSMWIERRFSPMT